MKAKTLLVAAVMFLALSAAAFAQATYQVGSVPVSAVVATGNAEKAGDITFTQVSGGTSVAGTITVTYPVAITVPITVPSVINCTGDYLCDATHVYINQSFSNFGPPGVIVINIPGGAATGSFTLSGVRIQASAFAVGAVNITANISTVNNAILAGQTAVTVITSVADGLGTIKVADPGAIPVSAISGKTTPETGASVTLKIPEGFPSAFQKGTGVVITVQAPPKGITYTFNTPFTTTGTGIASGSIFAIGDSTGAVNNTAVTITSTSTALSVYYYMATPDANADQVLETLPLVVAISGAASNTPLAVTSFSATTISLAPISPAFGSNGKPDGLPVPRYNEKDQGPFTILTVKGATTALLMPYVSWTGAAGGNFDTGIAISNTTADPGATNLGITTAAAKIAGPITFYFYPQSGTAFNYSTTKGTAPMTLGTHGLDASGNIVAGGTYVSLLSEVLSAATGVSPAAPFQGYVFAVANFTNAHGMFVLSNFTTFGQAALMLVVGTDRFNIQPESLGN